jgi:hypothetical protein
MTARSKGRRREVARVLDAVTHEAHALSEIKMPPPDGGGA